MNLELRKKILKHSLVIENRLSEILLTLFSIKKDSSKTLGFKSSSLSFKLKVDLLHDLGMFNDENYKKKYGDVYKNLILFMEIRNQFIHNLDADNFIKVLNRLDRVKNLKKIINNYKDFGLSDDGSEEMYFQAFDQMSYHIDGQLYELKNDIEEQRENELLEKLEAKENAGILEALISSIETYNAELKDDRHKKVLQKFLDHMLNAFDSMNDDNEID